MLTFPHSQKYQFKSGRVQQGGTRGPLGSQEPFVERGVQLGTQRSARRGLADLWKWVDLRLGWVGLGSISLCASAMAVRGPAEGAALAAVLKC